MKTLLIALCILLTASAFSLQDEAFLRKYSINRIHSSTYGHFPQKGDEVKVHYTGKLLSGVKFDSSKDRNQPFSFKVGVGQVIVCWDEVIQSLSLGDHVKVICPHQTAYGSRGAGGVIPPNADLEFEIEMLAFGKHRLSDL